MTPITGFLVFLLTTLGLLAGVVFTGVKSRRRQHLPLVACTFVTLGLTIFYAEQLGEEYDLKAAGRIYPIHLLLAKLTVVAYMLPIVTGVMTIRNADRRPLHSRVAILVLVLTVVTAVTGTLMVLWADPLIPGM